MAKTTLFLVPGDGCFCSVSAQVPKPDPSFQLGDQFFVNVTPDVSHPRSVLWIRRLPLFHERGSPKVSPVLTPYPKRGF